MRGIDGGAGVAADLVPAPTIAAVVGAAVVAVALYRRLDGWQRLFALTLLTTFLATSYLPFASGAFYARYVAAGALAVWSFHGPRVDVPAARTLIRGLWLAVVVAAGLAPLSINRPETAPQVLALAFLAAIVHGTATGRWATGDQGRIVADLSIPVTLFAVVAVGSLAADRVGIGQTRAFDGRFQGLFANPNTLSTTFTLAFMVSVAIWAATRRPAYLIAAAPLLICLLYAESRTAIVAAAGAIMFGVIRRGATAIYLGAFGLGLLVLVLYATGTNPLAGIEHRFVANEGGDLLNTRSETWDHAIYLWHQRVVGGYGYASGPTLFAEHGIGQGVVHNSYLQWTLETGIIGWLPLAVLLVACSGAVLRRDMPPLAVGLAAVVLAGLLIQITESAMFGTGQAYPYVFWLAVAAALTCQAAPRFHDDSIHMSKAPIPPTSQTRVTQSAV